MLETFSRLDPGWVLFIGVFVGALLLIEGLRQLSSRRETDSEARTRRMRLVAQGHSVADRLDILVPGHDSELHLFGMNFGALLVSAGMRPHPVLYSLVLLTGFAATAFLILPLVGLTIGGVFSFCLWVVLPILILVAMRNARQKRISSQLPDALELMARGLKAGHPLSSSIATVADTMPDPIATEFGIVVDQISYGDELVAAIKKLAARNPNEDFQYLAASVAIQHGTGGNLGRVLLVLSGVMRGRLMMRRRITAMSAEGRISALILSCIPFLMVGLNSIITPSYYGDVVSNPMFVPLAAVALGLIATNALVMYRLVNFRI